MKKKYIIPSEKISCMTECESMICLSYQAYQKNFRAERGYNPDGGGDGDNDAKEEVMGPWGTHW